MHDVNPNTTSALFFTVDGQQYALDIAAVQAVVPVLEIRALPGAPAYIPGVISYRGCIVPVIDIAKMLCDKPANLFYSTRIAIVDYPASTGSRPSCSSSMRRRTARGGMSMRTTRSKRRTNASSRMCK